MIDFFLFIKTTSEIKSEKKYLDISQVSQLTLLEIE